MKRLRGEAILSNKFFLVRQLEVLFVLEYFIFSKYHGSINAMCWLLPAEDFWLGRQNNALKILTLSVCNIR